MRNNNVYFGWKDVERIYLREEKKLDSNVGRRIALTKHCVYLEKYTLMNVTYAKSPFTEKTICKAIQYLYLHLNVATSTLSIAICWSVLSLLISTMYCVPI